MRAQLGPTELSFAIRFFAWSLFFRRQMNASEWISGSDGAGRKLNLYDERHAAN